MSLVKSNPHAETDGVSPKVAWPTAGLAVLGVILMVLDAVGVIDVEDEIWITLLGSSAGVAGVGFSSPAAVQNVKTGTTFTSPEPDVPPVGKHRR